MNCLNLSRLSVRGHVWTRTSYAIAVGLFTVFILLVGACRNPFTLSDDVHRDIDRDLADPAEVECEHVSDYDTSPTWTWTGDPEIAGDPVFRYRVNGGEWNIIVNETEYSPGNLYPRTYRFELQQRNAAGNWSLTKDVTTVILVRPSVLDIVPDTLTDQATVMFSWNSSEQFGNGGDLDNPPLYSWRLERWNGSGWAGVPEFSGNDQEGLEGGSFGPVSIGPLPDDLYRFGIAERNGGGGRSAFFVKEHTDVDPSGDFRVFRIDTTPAETHFAGGEGTEADPFLITTPDHLQNIAFYTGEGSAGLFFQLSNDLDLAGIEWTPLGSSQANSFQGVFDGAGHSIANLTIENNGNGLGLFGYLRDATISRVDLIDVSISNGGSVVGGIAGYSDGSSLTIYDTSVTGTINAVNSAGGLVGESYSDLVLVERVRSSVEIDAAGRAGGLIGLTNYSGSGDASVIEQSFSTGTVVITGDDAGGLVGLLTTGDAEAAFDIVDSYSITAVTGVSRVGGIVGSVGAQPSLIVRRSYAAGRIQNDNEPSGGLIGDGTADTGSSVYDYITTGQDSADGAARSTSEMTRETTFIDLVSPWDFANTWSIIEGSSYPYLTWQDISDAPEPIGLFSVGQPGPAGGWVFYDKGAYTDSWRYLEAGPEDLGPTAWADPAIDVDGTSTDIGTGLENTGYILDRFGEVGEQQDRAVHLAWEHINGGYDDWFLPSRDELEEIRLHVYNEDSEPFVGQYYWSSSQNDMNSAWDVDMETGEQGTRGKTDAETRHVRPARRF